MVKWIKITTDIFDDEKIKIIDTMPARDEILVIWFKILALAGKTNQSGMLFMNNKIAYTPEMLSAIFNRELNTVNLALTTFESFGMIEVEENRVITVSNWEKHQNVDGLDKIRIQTNERVKRHREKQKQLLLEDSNVSCNVTVTESNALEEEKEIEKSKNKDICPVDTALVVNYLNSKCGTNYKQSTKKTKDFIKARANDGYLLEDFKIVIDKKSAEWLNTEQAKYLRPETLFGNKFESYLNQLETKTIPKHNQVNDRMSSENDLMAKLAKKNKLLGGHRY